MKDEEPIFEEDVERHERRTGRLEDKFKFGKLVKLDQAIFVPLGKRTAINLRQNINQHKRWWEKETGKIYMVCKAERKGKPGFRIFLKQLPEK